MSTKETFQKSEIRKDNTIFSSLRSVVETAMYGNNVKKVISTSKAYKLALNSPGTIVTDLLVKYPEKLGLPDAAKVLVENGGAIVGRTAVARRIVGNNKEEDVKLASIAREAVYQGSLTERYKASAYVGLDKEFMIKAHLSVPKGQENNLYSWLLNFQITNDFYDDMYSNSHEIDAGDIFIYSDPYWKHPDYPLGLAYFDTDHNTAVILGLNYFGELKKATLTLAWGTAHKIGFASCHGGQKKFTLPNDTNYVSAFFGLSGSGKSTLTHAKHNGKYPIEVLHDDAFIISLTDGSSIALEPAYFDKTQDYPSDHEEIDYFVTVQNVAVTLDNLNNKVLLTEDVRNGNGRTVKSRYSTPNRVDRFEEPINAIYWIMKDDSLPPVIKVDDPTLAASFGATLATKRSTAERLKEGVDMNKLVIVPYANPFRVYPLTEDYEQFKHLFEVNGIDCYIINTGFFLDKKITPSVTLNSIEAIVEAKAKFNSFGNIKHLSYMSVEGYEPDFDNETYKQLVHERLQMRVDHIIEKNAAGGLDILPDEVLAAMKKIIK
ncbi:phosphoenolpyruvate carboxykinase (ATP) [Carnobacterium iners]|uniref:phosphoenolpyruvate carboxykinase (ATP) n=1 Tax=Carnobacterium iners TaxID=1073423 RepID=A0A1X7NJ42_9LACT|nr:phosphoenolpyruvate carboxykinase (ATP) [Carnobacterium iners]SEK67262.1 phosphoenolpyruvate carboxykinase (ATP) [Carnobacterium iners]SMH37811.1 phosphoenolpyruvate carboxykinase (ATP) [Carnobacterium iners]